MLLFLRIYFLYENSIKKGVQGKMMNRKWFTVGIILLFTGVTLISSIEAVRIENNFINNRMLLRPNGQPLFLTKFYGVGVSSSSMKTFVRGFRLNFPFEFTTADSYVYIWFPKYSHSQWQEWNYTGPETYNAVLFFGSVQKINDTYVIEGRCLFLQMFPYP
jgi:hypothetical protein